jgi:hypothetical protein
MISRSVIVRDGHLSGVIWDLNAIISVIAMNRTLPGMYERA